jgi:hypothetical protein
MNGIIGLIYLAIGVLVALSNGYFVITNLSQLISLLLAILLWPLILFGVNLHLSLGV